MAQVTEIRRRRVAHNFVDMTGLKVGRLTVLEFAETLNKAAQWFCKCDCGNIVIVSRPALRATQLGSKTGTRSCGCSRLTGTGSRPYYKLKSHTTLQTAKNRAFGGYKKAAKKRGLEFSLSEKEFHSLVQEECHYCGSPPTLIKKGTAQHSFNVLYRHNGIDRKDNSLGYTLENSLPCCSICNHAKHTLSYDEFIAWVQKASNYIDKHDVLIAEELHHKPLLAGV